MTDPSPLFRILDANANRAAEGLRVVEEYLRFTLGDRHLTELCKRLRHELAAVMQRLPAESLLRARDTRGDIGTEVTAADEFRRSTPHEIYTANQKRVEQSLRCLEEYSKPIDSAVAQAMEQIRYQAYTLARAIVTTERSREQLRQARLYLIIDGCDTADRFQSVARTLVAAGAPILQLRDKGLTDRECLERARLLRDLTRGTPTLFIMNDRPDLAELADADGVHVGQEELRVAEVRSIVGTRRLVGVSTHSIEQARTAVLDGADYLGCGPVFPSGTKSFEQFPGLDLLQRVSAEITLPAFAIGGISEQNLPAVRQTGFTRVAVSGAVMQSPAPDQVVRRMLTALAAPTECHP